MSEKREMNCPFYSGVENKCTGKKCPFYVSDEDIVEFKKAVSEKGWFCLITSNCSNTFITYNGNEKVSK